MPNNFHVLGKDVRENHNPKLRISAHFEKTIAQKSSFLIGDL